VVLDSNQGFTLPREALFLYSGLQPFLIWLLRDRVSVVARLACAIILIFYTSPHRWMIGVNHHTQLLSIEMGSQYFCLSWPVTGILLVSVSQVAKITGVSHTHLAHTYPFLLIYLMSGRNSVPVSPS
jgi:hypothetical protein